VNFLSVCLSVCTSVTLIYYDRMYLVTESCWKPSLIGAQTSVTWSNESIRKYRVKCVTRGIIQLLIYRHCNVSHDSEAWRKNKEHRALFAATGGRYFLVHSAMTMISVTVTVQIGKGWDVLRGSFEGGNASNKCTVFLELETHTTSVFSR